MMLHSSLRCYFENVFEVLPVQYELKAYMVSIFSKYQYANYDLSKSSLTLEYALAKNARDFERFQNVGDYIFFVNALYPESFKNASKDYYHSIGQMSYSQCYSILNREWKIYEQLADQFIDLSERARIVIRNT